MIYTIKKFAGLYTHPSPLSQVPEGSLAQADECTIDREGILENRRGFNFYGSGVFTNAIKQVLEFKKRILVHEGTNLSYDSDGAGSFVTYSGAFNEPASGIKLRGVELNGSLFFNTASGLQKIDALANAPTQAGVPKALDAQGSFAASANGMQPFDSQLAYRIVWGIKDANAVTTRGAPSSRCEITNALLTISTLTSSGTTATATTLAPHGYSTGDLVTIQNTESFRSATGTYASATNTVTITSTAHGFANGDIVTVKGFEQSAVNGSFVIRNITANTFDYTVINTTLPATLTGTGLCGKFTDSYNGIFTVTSTGSTTFTYQILGTPAPTAQVKQGALAMQAGKNKDVSITFPIPANITTNHFYEIYRSAASANATISADDRVQLVYTSSPSASDITAKTITVTDIVPDVFRGADLYTNAGQEGIGQANDLPPFAKDIAEFKSSLFYANTQTVHGLNLGLISPDGLKRNVDTITIAGTTYQFSTVENGALNPAKFKLQADLKGTLTAVGSTATFTTTASEPHGYTTGDLVTISGCDQAAYNGSFAVTSTGATTFTYTMTSSPVSPATGTPKASIGTPAQNIAATVKSLIRVINKATLNTSVYAYYVSSSSDIPGKFRLEARTLGGGAFAATASSTAVGGNFSPMLPTSGTTVQSVNETWANRVYYSKTGQPDSVPALNYLPPIGSRDRAILRIIGLRDSLFVIKEDGVFRVSGDDPRSFTVSAFDSNVFCLAGETVTKLNNAIYFYSNQGVVSVGESGVSVVSRPIEIDIVKIASYSGYASRMFAVSYESERKYILFTPDVSTDTVPTVAWTYNTFTNAWTRWKKPSTAALVLRNSTEADKLYIANTYTNTILKERKTADRNDYKDEAVASTLSNVDNNAMTATLTYSYSSFPITVGMLIEQGAALAKITAVSGTTVTLDRNPGFSNGACTVSRPVSMAFRLVPFDNHIPSSLKVFREIQCYPLADTFTLSNAVIASDLSSVADVVTFTYPTRGLGWGSPPWGQAGWGDDTNPYGATPTRTYVPRGKARCRALSVGFNHAICNERVSILNVSYVFEMASERSTR